MRLLLTTIFSTFFLVAYGQIKPIDSINKLNEIVVKGYYNPQSLLRAIGSVNILDSNLIKNQPNSSLLNIVNTAPGVRMEERSPGSYRLSLRGSLLRSPFGVRNIKIYIDDFPLTDAGGNTYLNALDVTSIGSIEIYKGPEASIFGANTGGAVLISPATAKTNMLQMAFTAGSYGLRQQNVALQQVYKNYRFSLVQGYQQNNGYRENSALKRKFIQTVQTWDYSAKGQAKAFLFYSDLNYQTPGGSTAAQLAINPRSARQDAILQKAGIYNRTLFGGLSNNYQFNGHIKHVLALFASYTDFKNPFITNFEKRYESTFGIRSFVEYASHDTNNTATVQAGVEASGTNSIIRNYGNDKGTATAIRFADDLNATQQFGFLKVNLDIKQRLLIELSSSLNFYGYHYERYLPIATGRKQRNFTAQLMPKVAVSYLLGPNFTYRASIAKGYSPPSIAEVRASDNTINNDLQAEAGWNYENGFRYQSKNRRFFADGTLFYFNLKDAIVRRLNGTGAEYFINAGGTKQLGTELQWSWWLIQKKSAAFFNGLQWRNSFTYSHFRFNDFKSAQKDYSGNRLTGVPKNTIINSLEFNFKKGIYLFAQHNYTSQIPLNDANTTFANNYHLIDLKTGARTLKLGKIAFDLSFGIGNLFNQHYSLGNDLNAADDRYFNAAAGINYYTGLSIKL